MRLNRFTDYSLRVLLLVAANPERRVRLSELTEYYKISIDHLRKVVHNLSKLGYLDTYRGKNGGMVLAIPAVSINIGTLIAQTEGDTALIDCGDSCPIVPICELKDVLHEAHQAFFAVLKKVTLADLIDKPKLIWTLQLDNSSPAQ